MAIFDISAYPEAIDLASQCIRQKDASSWLKLADFVQERIPDEPLWEGLRICANQEECRPFEVRENNYFLYVRNKYFDHRILVAIYDEYKANCSLVRPIKSKGNEFLYLQHWRWDNMIRTVGLAVYDSFK